MANTDLQQARGLTLPTRQEMLARSPSVQRFWDNNRGLLQSAWSQWQMANGSELPLLDEGLIDSKLRQAVENAWQQPSTEDKVKDLWQEVSPGVYQGQFLDPEKLHLIRGYLKAAAESEIPLRPPYGLVLNRNGAMLDQRSEGYLAAPGFQDFYQPLMDKYTRPIARLLFPEITGSDSQTFGFSIQYQPGKDTSLRLHTDASAVTLNININLPGEDFTGSEVDFADPATGAITRTSFTPGMAMIHRGHIPHAAHPITSGERSNLVLWLYGERGFVPRGANHSQSLSAEQRWQPSRVEADRFAPF